MELSFDGYESDKHIKNRFIRCGLSPLSYCSLLSVCASSVQATASWRLMTGLERGSMFMICVYDAPNWFGCSSWENLDLCFLCVTYLFISLKKDCFSWTWCYGSLLWARTLQLSSLCDDATITLSPSLSTRTFWAVASGQAIARSSHFAYWCSCSQFHWKLCLHYSWKHRCGRYGWDWMRLIRSICLSFTSLLTLFALLHYLASKDDVRALRGFNYELI